MPSLKQSAPVRAAVAALAAGALLLMPAVALAQQAPAAPQKAPAKKQQQPAQQPAQQQPAQQPAQQQPAQQPAQQQAAPAPSVVQVKSEPSQTDWTKACGKDPSNTREICYTTRDFVSDQNVPVIAVAVYDVKGDANKMVRFLLPLQLLLPPGLRVGFDQSQPLEGRYAICFPNGCFAEVPMKEADIASMKKSTNLNVSVQNQVGTVVTFQVPLAGFARAFDGAPVDPQKLEEQKQEMKRMLEQKGQDELKQRGGTGVAPKQ